MSDHQPTFTWTRVEPGHYVAQDGETTIRREQTTFPIGRRGAVEYRWRLYFPGRARYVSQRATLAEVKNDAERRLSHGR